jgi:uncharacterized membrane protein
VTPHAAVVFALVAVLVLSKPFLKTWARRRAPEGQYTSWQRSYRWATIIAGIMLVAGVLMVVFR